MQELKLSLSHEQPKINQVLERHIAELPVGARPVARHVLMAGGKRLRPLLTLLTGRALGSNSDVLYELGAAVEILHAATLLHDDILDNATLRRGKPAAHMLYGASSAVLAGDVMLAKALLMVSALGDTRLTACVAEAVMRTAEGEMAEFAKLRNTELSQEDYVAIITGKTAWMLRASCELGALFAGAQAPLAQAAADFGLELGIAFQMVDDALDFSPADHTGKPTGGDVKEGKITPPLLLYIADLPEKERVAFKRRFQENALDSEELEALSLAIYTKGYAQQTRELADKHLVLAQNALECFPESSERLILRQMLSYIQRREQ